MAAQSISTAVSQPFFIGIAGGTASGKTTVCNRITQSLGGQRVALISLDEFYRDLTPEECANINMVNFDEPGAFDIATMTECLDVLRRCEPAEIPMYDFVTSKRDKTKTRHVSPADVIIIEGILVLHIPELVSRFNMKIFVDTDDDVRLARRIRRDTVERGRDVEGIIFQYTQFVKPSFEQYVLPSKTNADVIIPWREDNPVAVDLITEHVRTKLSQSDLTRIYRNLNVMPSTMQTRGMHTVIRSRQASREDFVFYADRLIRLVVEHALGILPFQEQIVVTPTGDQYAGVAFSRSLCGVSIIRSGEAMENALRACCAGIRIGKILVDNDEGGGMVYEKLPHDIADRHVLLMSPTMGSGNTARNTIRYLVKHRNVDESKIILLALIVAPPSIHRICLEFPKVRLITSEIDEGLGPDNFVKPGIGDFGDRYFGTMSTCDEQVMITRTRTKEMWALKPDSKEATPSTRGSPIDSPSGAPSVASTT